MTPIAMGAGYSGGVYFFLRAFLGKQWHRIALAFTSIAVFCWFMAGATLLHLDKFNYKHPTFYVWVIVYALTPVVLPLLWLINRRTDPGTLEPGDILIPRPIRVVLLAASALDIGIGVWMFLFPQSALQVWPWPLTPLTARVLAGWFALSGSITLTMALDKRWSAAEVMIEGGFVYLALLLIGIVRAWSDFDTSNPLTYVYIALIAGSLVGAAALYVGMSASRKRQSMSSAQPAGASK
jgi:hypothetical protein